MRPIFKPSARGFWQNIWVDCSYEDRKYQNANRTRAELIAEILRDYERYGDAMRYLNANVQEILRLIAELRPQPPPAPA
jgi:hypothetical protein